VVKIARERVWREFLLCCFGLVLSLAATPVSAQTCYGADDMDVATRSSLENAGKRYFDFLTKGDSASLQKNAIASLASSFSGIENAVKGNQSTLAGTQPTVRPPYLLKAEGNAPSPRAEFLCGVFGANGQTANSAEFVIPNLSPGTYGLVMLEASTPKGPYTASFVLQQEGANWKVGGLYIKAVQVADHDGNWYADRARAFKAKGQNRDAWLYYREARELLVPLPFMYTQLTDKLYDEMQTVSPSDLPKDGNTLDLVAGGKTYKLTTIFPLAVDNQLDLVVKYQSADVSDTAKTFQDNMTVTKALVAKYPEFRDAFDGVVARAVETSGRDYGSLLPMKEIR